jgi:hypothetical protein
VKDRWDELQQRITARKILMTQAQPLVTSFSEADLISFFDRKKVLGEWDALQWAMNKGCR